jgi:glycosyltransferase involved in cell wall biosynthesis
MSLEYTPLISIIIAVFNGANTLQQCIDSVVQQSYLNKELIIIDAGSTDGTVELLQANNEHINYWVSEPDKGIYSAWNKALVQAKGEWIYFLGADDFFWNNQVLAQLAKHLIIIPTNIRVVYGQVMLLNKVGDNIYPIGKPWKKVKRSFMQVMSIPHQGIMHRHGLFEQHGMFDESFRIAGDYEFLLRELKTGDAVFISDVIISAMRQGGISSNPENTLETMREFRRSQRIHGQCFPRLLWLITMARLYLRLFLWHLFGEKLTRKVLDLGRRVLGLPAFWTKT